MKKSLAFIIHCVANIVEEPKNMEGTFKGRNEEEEVQTVESLLALHYLILNFLALAVILE
jgi:hypothetical protein